jgi:hypothetical protein
MYRFVFCRTHGPYASLSSCSVFDGDSASAPPLLYQWTGPVAPSPFTSTGNSLYIWFLSTAYYTSKGVVVMVTFDQDVVQPTPTPLSYPLNVAPVAAPSVFRCGPYITTGVINASGSSIITDPMMPFDEGAGHIDCGITVAAPPNQVIVLSYVNYSLAENLDYWSVFDGSSAAAPALVFRATGQLELAPVVISSTPYLFVRFQSIGFAVGVGRGVTAVISYMPPPRVPPPTPTPVSTPTRALPLACVNVAMNMRPWDQDPNPTYVLGFQRAALGQCSTVRTCESSSALCSFLAGYINCSMSPMPSSPLVRVRWSIPPCHMQPPATIDVSAFVGQYLTLGYQAEGTTVTLRDGVTYQVSQTTREAPLLTYGTDLTALNVALSSLGSRAAPPTAIEPTLPCLRLMPASIILTSTVCASAVVCPVYATSFGLSRTRMERCSPRPTSS